MGSALSMAGDSFHLFAGHSSVFRKVDGALDPGNQTLKPIGFRAGDIDFFTSLGAPLLAPQPRSRRNEFELE